MKFITLRLLLATATFGVLASLASADLGPQKFQTLRSSEQFRQLKPGDKIAYVCNQCKTVSEKTVESSAQAMEHCKEGATLTCPSCKAKMKISYKAKQGRNDAVKVTEVVYTNDKGEECLFMAKVTDPK